MILAFSHLFYQQYWWVIISLLAGLLVFLMFVQGGQSMIRRLGKNEIEKSLLVNSLGRKWEFTFTTLVTFGGAFFASFPLFYATSFGGAYWLWMAILFSFILQAISYEFRKKPNNIYGSHVYEWLLMINGIFGPVLIGVAVGTFFTGSYFSINEVTKSVTWQHPLHGLEALGNWQNITLGLTVLFLARTLALLYFINNIHHQELTNRAKKWLLPNSIVFVVLFLTFTISLLMSDGYAYNAEQVVVEPLKYLANLTGSGFTLGFLLSGVVLVLFGIFIALFKDSHKGIWYSGIGTIIVVFTLFLLAGLSNTAFYPSTFDHQSSLTIINSSSSFYTLKTMSFVSLIIPLVVAYIFYAWRSMNNKKLTNEELEQENHKY